MLNKETKLDKLFISSESIENNNTVVLSCNNTETPWKNVYSYLDI